MKNQETKNVTLREAASLFVSSLTPSNRDGTTRDVNNFARWCGWDRTLVELTAPEISNYAERAIVPGPEANQKIGSVKAFLCYVRKEGFTQTNLGVHLKLKKTTKKTTTNHAPKQGEAMSAEGFDKIRSELEKLKKERRVVAEELHKAAADKDVRENAPLEAARDHQGQLEAKIRQLEDALQSAVLVQKANTAKVESGDTVVLVDLESQETFHYTLVHPSQVDVIKGKISCVSATGKVLLGKSAGETIEVVAPVGILHYKIEAIER